MNKFIESFDEYHGKIKIEEASEIAEFNIKIKEMGEDAKAAREKASEAKDNYEKFIKKNEHQEARIELLKHTKYKAKAEMLNASIDLLLMTSNKKSIKDESDDKKDNNNGDK